MSNTHIRSVGHLLMIAGVLLLTSSGVPLLQAQLVHTGQGSTVTSETLHSAATAPATNDITPGQILVLGILLTLMGGFLHALSVLREDQPVHITVRKTKRKLMPVEREHGFLMMVQI